MSIVFTMVYLVFGPVQAFDSISVKMENQYTDESVNSGKVSHIACLENSELTAWVMS